MKEKTATQRLLSLLLACVLCLTCTPVAFAESAVAASMRLMKTEGTVSVSNSSGRAVTQTERMSLRSGYQLKTEEKSYAWINLDDVKMVEMDAVTEISIRKKDRKLDILVDSGNLLFKVDQHLEGDENLNIRTSTMGVGIRGTCGWVKVIDQWTSQIYILEGTVAVTVTDPVTGETKTENISAGEMAICTVYPQDRAGSKCEIVRQEFTVADIDGFVLVELTPNKPLCDKIYEESGLDLRDPSVKPAEKLKQDQELVRDKLEEIEKQLQEQEDKISVEPVWTNPVPDPVPATPNADSSSGGGGGGGGSTSAPTETITLTMPQTAATVNAYLGRSSVRQVILQPGAARASSANLLEVDSPLTVPNGKILTLQATVGLTLNEDQTLSVYGTMTVDGECRLYGSLVPNKNAVIKAKFFEIPDHLADWQVSETPGSDGFYSLFYSPKGTVYTVAFDANGGTVAPGELVTGTDGRLAALPTPVREGYAFNGWFTAAEGGAQVTTATVFTQNATIYAHWTEDAGIGGDNWEYDPAIKTLYISGNGPMDNFDGATNAPWDKYRPEVVAIVVREGVTSIGDFAFVECPQLVTMDIPVSVTSVGNYATSGSNNLADVYYGGTEGQWHEVGIADGNDPLLNANIHFTGSDGTACVTFNPNGGAVTPQYYFVGLDGKVGTLPTPVREGYTFDGWFTAADGGTQITTNTVFTQNTTVYAHWTGETSGVTWRYDEATKTLYIEGSGEMEDYASSAHMPWVQYVSEIRSVNIKNGVTSIGVYAFSNCTSLTSVTIPSSVTRIGKGAFLACSSLPNVSIPEGVTSLEKYVFMDCTSLASVNIPDSVTKIDEDAFCDCSSLASVTIPNNVTSIGNEAFIRCTSLTSVTIPSSVTSIGYHAFHSCTNLTSVTIPNSVTSIGYSAFEDCTSLTSVTIPASVTSIDGSTFSSCTSLTSVTIPVSVIRFGNFAFSSCTKLTDVYYNGTETQWNAITINTGNEPLLNANIHFQGEDSGVTWRYDAPTKTLYIEGNGPMDDYTISSNGSSAPWMSYKTQMQTLIIENGVTSLGDYAFHDCASLTGVEIPDSVVAIGEYAFSGCSNLYQISIPDSVTTINVGAFARAGLTNAYIPGSVTNLGNGLFNSCASLTNVDFGDGITSISQSMFMNCSSLTSVTVPGSVSTIDMSTFAGCSGLTSVTILDGVGSLGMRAFEFCSNLTNVTIPDSVTRIENLAFNGCNNLTDVYYSGTQDQWNAINTGTNNTSLTTANIHYNSRARSVVSNAASGYTDVPAGAAYAEAVNYCKANNLMTGTSDTTFNPDGTLTRAMMVTVLHRLAGKPAAASTASFTDVAAGKWYTDAIAWANSKGIVLGYNASTFGVNDPVTHEQVALIFQRYSGNPNVQTEGADTPKTPATRAEIALTLMNYAKTYQPGTLSSVSAIDVMCAPSGIALDKNGTLLVTDVFSKQLWRVENRTGTAYAGGATVPDLYGQPLGGYNDASLGSSTFKEPWAIAPFLDGWAVSDTANNAVRLVRTSGIQTLNAATKEKLTVTNLGVAFNRPTGLAADGDGNLYVSDTGSGTVRRVSPQGGVTTVAKNLSDPMGLCWKNGTLYIAETGRNRIVKLEKGTVSVVAGSGTADLTDGAAKTAAFSAPQGVTAGDDGSVYVADTGNSAIRKIKGGSVTTLVVQDPQQLSGGMISPTGLLLQGNSLYICDPFTRKIAILTVA